jgi:hypothetical protein
VEKRWGSLGQPPLVSGVAYFFFFAAFFFAAFFAFFAIVPPEGASLCLMATRLELVELHKPWPEPYALIPDVDYG